MKKIRLIWDFRGPEAKQIAAHHERHLTEYAEKHRLAQAKCGTRAVSEKHHTAWIEVLPDEMTGVRDALLPHRGEQVSTPNS